MLCPLACFYGLVASMKYGAYVFFKSKCGLLIVMMFVFRIIMEATNAGTVYEHRKFNWELLQQIL